MACRRARLIVRGSVEQIDRTPPSSSGVIATGQLPLRPIA
jgi:hypothetical protein